MPKINSRTSFFIFSFFLLGLSPVLKAETADPKLLLEKMDHVLRGSSHDMTLTLDVKTKNWERHYKIRVRMKDVDYAFARVLEPPKTSGQGFLRIRARLWNYLPTAERTILIPPSMMLDQFMGSDFSNDDFVKLSYLPRDYEGKIVAEEMGENNKALYHLELMPHPDAPVTYGKLELWVRKGDAVPMRMKFYNEKMEPIRMLHYSEVRDFGGHLIPSVWRMENLKEKDRQTLVTLRDAVFDLGIQDSVFTRENLEKYP